MTVINTNTAATITANALTKNERAMSQAMERLSTGVRINSASDDAAGLAIASRMTSQINGLNMAVRNANDAISMVNTADGAYIETTNMMQRMRELAVQAASGTMGSTDRTALNTEYQALSDEILSVSGNTQWNGVNILDDTVGTTGAVDFQVGANASQAIQADFGSLGTNTFSATVASLTAQTGSAVMTAKIAVTGGTLVDGDQISMKISDTSDSDGHFVTFTLGSGDATKIASGNNPSSLTIGHEEIADNYSADKATSNFFGSSDNLVIAAGGSTNSFKINGSKTSGGGTFTISDIHITRGTTAGVIATDITAVDHANAALKALDTAINSLNTQRSSFGATVNRLEYASDNLANVSQNASASRSRILDADYAAETTELARTQIIQQAGTAMLSQANQAAQSVLSLLK